MSRDTVDWQYPDKAKAMTYIRLTRRLDVEAKDGPRGSGLELMARVRLGGDWAYFGAAVRWTFDAVSAEEADKMVGDLTGLAAGSLPSLLFFCTVREDRVYVSWLDEPVGGDLVRHERPAFAAFTDEVFAAFLDRITAWHLARHPAAA